MTDWKFRCPRCKREYVGSEKTIEIPCICHMDCPYCGKLQTCTTLASRSSYDFSYAYEGYEKEPDPPRTLYGPCSNCGYYSSLPPIAAIPVREVENKFDEP